MEDYLTLKQASEITGYSSDYIGSLVRKGILKGKRFYKLNSWEPIGTSKRIFVAQKI